VALPEERKRIRALLAELPAGIESKTEELLRGLGDLWRSNPQEKVSSSQPTSAALTRSAAALISVSAGKGVEVLKGRRPWREDRAEKRFARHDGPPRADLHGGRT